MHSILIDQEVYDALAARATHPRCDTPNHVLRRVLGLPAATRPDYETTTGRRGQLRPLINAGHLAPDSN